MDFLMDHYSEFLVYQKELRNENNQTADDGYRKETGTAQCGDDSGSQCKNSGSRRLRGINDGRKGHDSKCYIRNIVQEGLQKLAFNLLTDQGQRKHPDTEGNKCHYGDIDINIMIHRQDPPDCFLRGEAMQRPMR